MGKKRKNLCHRKGGSKRKTTVSNREQSPPYLEPDELEEQQEREERNEETIPPPELTSSSSSIDIISPAGPDSTDETAEFVFTTNELPFDLSTTTSDENSVALLHTETLPLVDQSLIQISEQSSILTNAPSEQSEDNRISVIQEIIDVDKLPDRPDSPIGDDVIEITPPPPPLTSRNDERDTHQLDIVDLTDSEDNLPLSLISNQTGLRTESSHNEESDGGNNDELPNVLKMSNDSPSSSQNKVAITCPICMDDAKQILSEGKQLISTPCGHIFCNICIETSLAANMVCPTCRKKVKKKQLHPIFI